MGSVSVLLPLPFDHGFDYSAQADLAPGRLVRVPFGAGQRYGVVWQRKQDWPKADAATLKPVTEYIDLPALPADLIALIDKVAAYTLSPLGLVLKLALSCPAALGPQPAAVHVLRAGQAPERLTQARRRVLDLLADGLPRTVPDVARLANTGAGVVRGLVDAGTLNARRLEEAPTWPEPDMDRPAPVLRPEQGEAAYALIQAVQKGAFAPFLLDGITGSGKTEVYFEAIAAVLRTPDRQILVLLPEIALTAQWLDRFAARFGCAPLVWHSGLSPAERRRAWRAVHKGQARVVVGARSALFLPFPRLGLAVVDEEQDSSFKQEEGVLYHARDMAVWRAQLADCPIVLVSATPSLETRLNARAGRYVPLKLTQRHGRAVLPVIEAVDMRREGLKADEWLSAPLARAIQDTLEAREQTLLFLNRRGYAPLTLCRTCGVRLECPDCTAWLVEHRTRSRLQCHHCGYHRSIPICCPECGAEDSFAACGPGVERLAEQVLTRWPQARLAIMASDSLASPDETTRLVSQIDRGEIDIVVGTQLAAKGYHFPNLTLVGVVDADLGLRGGDLRAGERTYQQLVQVAGRAGRADKPGRVLLQSYDPGHPVVQALIRGDAEAFLYLEEEARAHAGMPPFTRLAALIVSGQDLDQVNRTARMLAASAPRIDGVDIWGPVPAPLARLRGRHRLRFLVRAPKSLSVQKVLRAWLGLVKPPSKVSVRVDVDPVSFF